MEWLKSKIERPVKIAGPCSAETREQILYTAERLKSSKIDFFRAGIWKPRTRPGEFEGVGKMGLMWLQEVKAKYGIAVCTEAANAKHVDFCLKAGIDMLWVGARTTTNPFAVQEIAESLRGVDIPVMVKNPINPDINLWIGALERLHKCGITKLGAIHRGFSVYAKTDYRNIPKWQIAIDLQNLYPELPLICDPSHIAGKRELIGEISQKAMDLNFDGLMVETHYSPEKAWTDAKQQITPASFMRLIQSLIIRQRNLYNTFERELHELRREINALDEELLKILSLRMKVSGKIGAYKKDNGMTILQNARWDQLLERNKNIARKQELSENFASKIFKVIHQESIDVQEQILIGQNS